MPTPVKTPTPPVPGGNKNAGQARENQVGQVHPKPVTDEKEAKPLFDRPNDTNWK